MRIFTGYLIAVFILSASCMASAQSPAFNETLSKEGLNLQEYDEIITFYYRNPQPDKLVSALKVTLADTQFLSDEMHLAPLVHFIAAVAAEDELFLARLNTLKEGYSGTQREVLERMIQDSGSFSSVSPNSPASLDFLWAEFLATGNVEPVRKIISVLGLEESQNKKQFSEKELNTLLLVGAAEWSLRSNAEQHRKVFQVLSEELAKAGGIKKQRLEKIMQQIKK